MAGWLPLFASAVPAFPSTFLGNPDANITALNTSGGIVSFWDSAHTSPRIPCLYQVSASAILATGTSRPYEDLHYAWNFGDASGTETFTRPTDGATVNANSDQIGPEAAYCYRVAGTYTITLTVAGAGGNVVTTKTKSVTIGAFTPSVTYYCDSNASGGNTGVDAANAFTSLASVNSAINHVGATTTSNILIYLAKGSTFTTGLGFNLNSAEADNYSGVRVRPYGSGAAPIINSTNDLNTVNNHLKQAIKLNCYSSGVTTFYDFVFEGIDIRQTNSTTSPVKIICDTRGASGDPAFGGNPSAPVLSVMENVYFLDCPMSLTDDSTNTQAYVLGYEGLTADRANKGGGMWNCSFVNPDAAVNHGSGISGSPQEWFFMLGCSISGNSTSNFNHHIYPDCADHELYKWSRFGKAGFTSGRGMCINMNWDWEANRVGVTPGVVLQASYHLVSECETMGTASSVDAGNRTNNGVGTDNITQFAGLVVERNSMHDHTNYQLQIPCATTFTVRDNRGFHNSSGAMVSPPDTAFYSGATSSSVYWAMAVMKGNIYRNRILISPGSNNYGAININDATNYSSPQQWTRNIIKDARNGTPTSGPCIWFKPSTQSTPGSVINRNQLYSVSNPSQIIYDGTGGGTSYNYAAWQATGFDANGTNTDPGWSAASSQWSDLN